MLPSESSASGLAGLKGFLDVHTFAHDGLVELTLKRQQIHVGLRLRDQLTDLGIRPEPRRSRGSGEPSVCRLAPGSRRGTTSDGSDSPVAMLSRFYLWSLAVSR
ncbi:hypothetical protein EYF80_048207 [Liparis tanakae]|uniref:Uncharacterized protein n=1 Tax=Liparis tanakae TaxID=230148 RepID=A0A4Z2FLJ9_9TELE|nr:hypothetical protein EYF80_048207 [Liparis tanakae]